jgi:MerR HTH family regulatory protein
MRRRMIGVSWHPGCPVGLGRLRLLTVSYWGFDHGVHQGQLIVNESAARALDRAFGLLFAARYPIRQIRPVDVFGGSDERSMLADDTSAFNCRRVWGTTSSTAEAAQLVGVKPATIRKWVQRGHLTARGLDEKNRPMYHPDDVIAAEAKVRDNGIAASGVDPRTTRRPTAILAA